MSYASKKKKITTENIIHVSSVEFHEEFNGTTPGAVKVGSKKRTQKKLQNSAKSGLKQGKKQTH